MASRKIKGLVKASLSPTGPFPDNPRLKGAAARGISFQRKMVRALQTSVAKCGRLLEAPWFRYQDETGTHWCQPDAVLWTWNKAYVFEAKLSLRRLDEALSQLSNLYGPVVSHTFKRPVTSCIVFHHWIKDAELNFPLVDCPEDLINAPSPISAWHLM